MTMNQKDAVYSAICNVTGHKGEGAVTIGKEQRAQVSAILLESFLSGVISYKGDFKSLSDADQKSYVSGLQSNWIRKDKRLNGGVKYESKNPGSRSGSTDPQLKAMRALLVSMQGDTRYTDADRSEVQAHIDSRTAEIAAAKQAKSVDFSALPADLAAKFSK